MVGSSLGFPHYSISNAHGTVEIPYEATSTPNQGWLPDLPRQAEEVAQIRGAARRVLAECCLFAPVECEKQYSTVENQRKPPGCFRMTVASTAFG